MSFLVPNRKIFGIDLASEAIRVAVIEQGFLSSSIQSINELPLSQTPWLKNGLRNKEKISQAIQEAMEKAQPHPIHRKEALIAIPETLVFSKVIQLPRVSRKELIQTIPYEASDFLPLPIEEVYLDWHVDDTIITIEDKPHVHILVVAAPKKLVTELQDMAQTAGIRLAGIESQPFAICRSVQHLLRPKVTSVIANIGQAATTIILATTTTVKFTTTAPVGSQKLSQKLDTDLSSIAEEINEGIKYYHNRLGEKEDMQQIIVTGPGALISNLCETLTKLTKINCSIGYPAIKLPGDSHVHPKFGTVVGLALWKGNRDAYH